MEAIKCKVCGELFVPKNSKVVLCSEECRVMNGRLNSKKHREAEKALKLVTIPPKFCRVCGKEFRTEREQAVTCSKECSVRNTRLRAMDYYREKKPNKRNNGMGRKKKENPLATKTIQADKENTTYGKLVLRDYLEQQSIEMAKRRREIELEWEKKRKAKVGESA